jgi:TPR repeat protein
MRLIALVALALLATLSHAGPDTSRHNPGLHAYVEATRLYERAEYSEAYRTYRQSARWGNKLSQFNIGTMYYNGIGVSRDAARAWAWIELSAERGYPQLVNAADEIWRELDEQGRERARRVLTSELQPQYADAVALPRTQRYVNRRYRAATGSRLGGGAPSNPLLIQPRDDHTTIGDVFYDPNAWHLERWLEQEAAWFERMMETGEPVAEFEDID